MEFKLLTVKYRLSILSQKPRLRERNGAESLLIWMILEQGTKKDSIYKIPIQWKASNLLSSSMMSSSFSFWDQSINEEGNEAISETNKAQII